MVSVVDANNHETDFVPTLADQLQSAIYPATAQTGTGRGHTDLVYLYPGGPPTLATETDGSGVPMCQTAFGYGPEGELVSQSGDTETARYQYDAAARPDKLIDGNQAATTYRYTLAGYLSSVVYPKGGAAISHDADNQISQNPADVYDGNGNPTTYQAVPLVFDPEGHVSLVSQSAPKPVVSFGYTGDGLRAWKQAGTNPSSRIYFLYDGSQPVLELDSSGTVIQAANTFGANGLLSRHVAGASTFYTFDPQGSVCQRFGNQGTLLSSDAYDAYGALQGQTPGGVGDVFGFGAQWDYYTDPEDGLVLLTNRYYDPGTERCLNRDPLGQAGARTCMGMRGTIPAPTPTHWGW